MGCVCCVYGTCTLRAVFSSAKKAKAGGPREKNTFSSGPAGLESAERKLEREPNACPGLEVVQVAVLVSVTIVGPARIGEDADSVRDQSVFDPESCMGACPVARAGGDASADEAVGGHAGGFVWHPQNEASRVLGDGFVVLVKGAYGLASESCDINSQAQRFGPKVAESCAAAPAVVLEGACVRRAIADEIGALQVELGFVCGKQRSGGLLGGGHFAGGCISCQQRRSQK